MKHFLIVGSLLATYTCTQNMVTNVPVASLRTAPINYTEGTDPDVKTSKDMFGHSYDLFVKALPPALRDPIQDTQLLYNEKVVCLEKIKDGWLKVKLPEQYGYNVSKKKFEHTIGYIQSNQVIPQINIKKPTCVVTKPWTDITVCDGTTLTVPMGTKLYGSKDDLKLWHVTLPDGRTGTVKKTDIYCIGQIAEPADLLRTNIVSHAKQLTGKPYCWGGRNPSNCDCSGLINMAYRASGLELSRNAHPMWLRSAKIDRGSKLSSGDLIFFAHPNRPDHINHVLMYLGGDMLIESCVSEGIVIRKTANRFGKPVATITYGDIIRTTGLHSQEYVIYFGSYLADRDRVQYMRDYALGNYDITRWIKNEQNG